MGKDDGEFPQVDRSAQALSKERGESSSRAIFERKGRTYAGLKSTCDESDALKSVLFKGAGDGCHNGPCKYQPWLWDESGMPYALLTCYYCRTGRPETVEQSWCCVSQQ